MSNNRQIHTNTLNQEEGNKFTFKGKQIYYLIKYLTIFISGCNWRYKCW